MATTLTPASQARVDRFVDTFLSSEFLSTWAAESVSSGGYARPGSEARDRHDRCYDAAEDGADGSTHAEVINDWREAFDAFLRNRRRWNDPERFAAAVHAHFDAVEAWHEQNGSLFSEIG